MKKIVILILIPIIAFSQRKVGQACIDSILVEIPKYKSDTTRINSINYIAYEYLNVDLDKSLQTAEKALKLSNKIVWNDGIASSYRSLGNYYVTMLDYKKAFQMYQTGFEATNNKKIQAKLVMGIGVVNYMQSNYPKSIENNFTALKLFEATKDKISCTKTLRNIATTYIQIGDYKNAIIAYKKCIKINDEINYRSIDSKIFNELGQCYLNLNNDKLALDYFKKGLKISEKEDDIEEKANSLSGIGSYYFKQKKINEALDNFNKSLVLFIESQDDLNIARAYSSVNSCYLELLKNKKNEKLKLEYAKKIKENSIKGLRIGKNISDLISTSKLYSDLSKAQKIEGNFKESLNSFEMFKIYNDSVFNSDNKETVKNLEDKREIELRDNQLKINKLSLEANQKQKWFLLSGIGFLAILGSLLFYQSLKRKQINLKLEILNKDLDQANKTKIRFFNILNHDLRSPVSNLIDFLHIQKNSPDLLDETTKTRIQETTLLSAENLLISMEDILLWSKGQMQNFKPQFQKVAISKLFEDTQKHFSSEHKVKISFENLENLEIVTDQNYLKTIFRNLTGNAIKELNNSMNPVLKTTTMHVGTKNGQITWKAFQKQNITFITVSDNGNGATREQLKALFDDTEVVGIKSGLGLHLIRDLAKAIDCEISVESEIGEGTTFILETKN